MTLMNVLYFHLEKAQPKYILDFMIGYILTFLLIELMRKKKVNMYKVTIFFAFTFLSIMILSYYIFSDISYYGSIRFKSFAKNPNQILFYGITLSLFVIMYIRQKPLKIACLVLIVYFMLKILSDAYYLSLFVAISMFLFLHIYYIKKLQKSLNILLYIFLITIVAIPIIYSYYNQIAVLWNTVDEGAARLFLFKNAFLSISYSSVIGLGIGSFSGIFGPFGGKEAHNTFLDLAMQFGIFFSFIIYSVYLIFVIKSICKKKKLPSPSLHFLIL